MKVLLVKPRHIGDSLIMTPTIRGIRSRYPHATIWVVVRNSCEGILAGCPDIDRIVTTTRPESNQRKFTTWLKDLKVLLEIRKEKFDYAIDLGESARGRWITFFSGAKKIATSFSAQKLPAFWKLLFNQVADFPNFGGHAVIKDFRTASTLLDLGEEIPPLVFEKNRTTPCPLVSEGKNFAFIHPGTRWKRKQWTLEKWIDLCTYLATQYDALVISTGHDEMEFSIARSLREHCGDKLILTEGKLSWTESADLLHRAKVFIGVDTAMSHLAAACQCPSVVLFGSSYEGAWRPWKAPHRIVLPPNCQELGEHSPLADILEFTKRKTSDVEVSTVLSMLSELRNTA